MNDVILDICGCVFVTNTIIMLSREDFLPKSILDKYTRKWINIIFSPLIKILNDSQKKKIKILNKDFGNH